MAKPNTIRKTKLTDAERQRVLMAMLLRSTSSDLKRGDLSAVAATEGIHPSTISRLWAYAKVEAARSGHFASPSRRNRSGRTASDPTPTRERLHGVDVAQRSTIRSAAAGCGMAPTTRIRQLRQGRLRTHTSVVKPVLTDANKAERLQFALPHIRRDTMEYVDMYYAVHVDEKLFFTLRSLLDAFSYCQTSSCRGPAPFRPRHPAVFDGKLEIWPLVEHVPAQRSSARRPAGIIITKEISVTKNTYRSMLIANLLPALHARWPRNDTTIVVQQDNVPAHIAADDAAFTEAVAAGSLNIRLRNQPTNSPDLNCNDLGLFSAIQAR
ncbi:hypothetical protein Pcac1_g11533 [Phytophthora cactorum]|uniref:DUF7769 domain-containing protein n=1 Tax=Phytophthora cactorum TaxID=29920 RepID=A0A329RPP1_9STRA|nr:hypothetical protein Pcac1_g11533 [Phytophthora cactorum]KAG2810217.1 hypothetical protein PC112_g16153 [Phytophthora cactorum]KAG2891313.1 hypothetical protein PC114_g17047 [Phytophthora cactorum]KAG2920862.1 hypothetical protein PC117_g16406 [Phytophthora cactorum]KAG3070731.1 hypothetical protein PC122_g15993 [Phytophthora cactorum]